MELEELLPFNFVMAFQTVLQEVLFFKLEQNCLQQFRLAIFTVYRAFALRCLYLCFPIWDAEKQDVALFFFFL